MKITEAGGEDEAVKQTKAKEAKKEKLNHTFVDLKKQAEQNENGENSNSHTDTSEQEDSQYEDDDSEPEEKPRGEVLFINTLSKAIESKLNEHFMGKAPTSKIDALHDLVNNSNKLVQLLKN